MLVKEKGVNMGDFQSLASTTNRWQSSLWQWKQGNPGFKREKEIRFEQIFHLGVSVRQSNEMFSFVYP